MRTQIFLHSLLLLALGACAPAVVPPALEREVMRGGGVLFLLVQEGDCGERLLTAARLDTLRSRSDLGVVALLVNADEDAAGRVSERFGVSYPVLRVPRLSEEMASLLIRMGHRATPLLVGVGPRGRTRFVLPVPADPKAQALTVDLAESHMARATRIQLTEVGP